IEHGAYVLCLEQDEDHPSPLPLTMAWCSMAEAFTADDVLLFECHASDDPAQHHDLLHAACGERLGAVRHLDSMVRLSTDNECWRKTTRIPMSDLRWTVSFRRSGLGELDVNAARPEGPDHASFFA